MYGAPSARWVLVSAMLCACSPLVSRADSEEDVVKVREDWALVVGDANTEIASPQVVTLMSPQPERDAVYAIFELNHQNLPSYQPGGMQLQAWSGGELLGYKDNERDTLLGSAGEEVTWTQEMSVASGVLAFRILDGRSTTWGDFAPEGTLSLSTGVSTSNLNGYESDYSVDRSGVAFGANRVKSLTLKKVRLYSRKGLIKELNTNAAIDLAR